MVAGEYEMSVKELVFTSDSSPDLTIKIIGNRVSFKFPDFPIAIALLDRNQVHMLCLYLQEYLEIKIDNGLKALGE